MSIQLAQYPPAQQCSRCGATGQPLQPYTSLGSTVPRAWLCPGCAGLFADVHPLPIAYVHPRFAPGQWVSIDPAIRSIHSAHPCAGQMVQVCEGTYYPLLEAYGERPHDTLVPVCLPDGTVLFVEQEYVTPSSANV